MMDKIEFLDDLPIHRPRWIRKIRLWDKVITLSAWGLGHLYIPIETVCKVFNLNYETVLRRLKSPKNYFSMYSTWIRMPVEEERETHPALCLNLSALPLFLASMDLEEIENDLSRETMRLLQLHAHGVLAEYLKIGTLSELVEGEHEIQEMIYRHDNEDGESDLDEVPF